MTPCPQAMAEGGRKEVDRIVSEGGVLGALKAGVPAVAPGEESLVQSLLAEVESLKRIIQGLTDHIRILEGGSNVPASESVAAMMGMVVGNTERLLGLMDDRRRSEERLLGQISDLLDEIRDLKDQKFTSGSHKRKPSGDGSRGSDRCEGKEEYAGEGEKGGESEGGKKCDSGKGNEGKDGKGDDGEDGKNEKGGKDGRRGEKGKKDEDAKEDAKREKVSSEFLGSTRSPRGSYDTMDAAKVETHVSLVKDIPAGWRTLRLEHFSEYDKVSYVVRHDYTTLVLEDEYGNEVERYFSPDPDNDRLPRELCMTGTHASPSLLADLVIKQFVLYVPNNRLSRQMEIDGFRSCPNTWANWKRRGAEILRPITSRLKEKLLAADSYIHVDESWEWVRIKYRGDGTKLGRYYKKYVWALVNKKAGIRFFNYDNDEDDSRAFRPIAAFLGDARVDIHSDAYVVYRQLAELRPECEVLFCWAHVRAKWWASRYISKDSEAEWFLQKIGYLYGVETECKKGKYTEGQIGARRRRKDVQDTLAEIKERAEKMLADSDAEKARYSAKLLKAIKYMLNGWDHLTSYTKDGRYDIDNCLAEQAIRPFCLLRKNSEHFGSEHGVEDACVYHTIIETLKLWGINIKQYLVDVFTASIKGIEDYSVFDPEKYASAHA